jgi:hypothetical protein
MSNFIQLSILYYRYLINKRVFINCIISLLILGFILVPSENAKYVTFYIGNFAATTNKFWIGNLAAMFSNVIISLLLLFIIIGEREKEVLNYNYTLEDTSPNKNFYKNFYKIIALFFVSLTLLFVLNLSLVLVNIQQVDLIYYVINVLYFSFSYLFFLSFFAFFIEYYVVKKTIKYILYISAIFIFLFNDKYFFDLIGINELHIYFNQIIKTKNHFAFGYLTISTNIKLISFNKFIIPLFIYKKVIWIIISLLLIYLLSKINISRQLTNVSKSPFFASNISFTEKNIESYSNYNISKEYSIKNILFKDLYLFSKSFTRFNIICIIVLWVSMFLIHENSLIKILPIIFLFTIPLNEKFLCKLFFYNLEFQEKISPFNKVKIFYSKFYLIIIFYIILLTPYFLLNNLTGILNILLGFIILTYFQIKTSEYFKNNLLLDIILIIIYASYLTGSPIINIFQL